MMAAPLLSACGSTAGSKADTTKLKRKGLQRRRHELTWVASFTGSTAAEISKLATNRHTVNGQWKLVFSVKDVNLTNPKQAPAAAGLILPGSRIRFAEDPTCPNQTKATTGLYTYRISGNRLTLAEVDHSDSCGLRVKALTSKTWIKGP